MGLTKPRASQIFDIDYKQATRVITVSNITLTGGAPASVDGVSLVAGDRVLVKGQSTASQNGLYAVSVVGSGEDGTWTRTGDGNETGEIDAGMIVMVTEGVIYADTQWKLITDNPIVIGTTPLIFELNTSGNSLSNGTSNVTVFNNSNVTVGVAGNNIATFSAGGISATGNITGSYILGNGSQLTGISSGATLSGNLAGNLDGNGFGANAFSFVSATGNITGGNLTTAGTLTATTVTETSSLALKENFRPIEDPLEKVLQLLGVIYDRKDGSSDNEVGLVAEDVAKVIPELVKNNSVAYTRLSVYLLESIRVLKQEIDQLKGKK